MLQYLHSCFSHSSLQNISSSIRLDRGCWYTVIFRCFQSCSIRFKSGLLLGHSRAFTESSQRNSFVIFALCLASLSCWKANLHPNLRTRVLGNRLSSVFSLYIAAFIFLSTLTSLLVPAIEKHPHSMMLPPPFCTLGNYNGQVTSCAWFHPDITLGIQAKESCL